jgi:hypothetical protein
MSTSINHDNSITVVGYSLPEFCFELCDLAAKGFVTTMRNDQAPNGGFGSYYSATLVPRHHYRIDLQGNHINVPNTSQETALKDDSSDVSAIGGTDVPETTNTAKTAVKRTATKNTT